MNKLILLAVIFLSAALSGCGGGGGGGEPAPQTVTVTGSLGQFKNVEALVTDLQGAILDGPVEIDANGQATFEIPGNISALVAIIRGDDIDAAYFDESTQTDRPFPGGQELRAIVSEVNSEIGVTLFTELAAAKLDNEMGGIPSATTNTIDEANELIRSTFLQGVSDITIPPTVVGSTSDQLGSSESDVYAAMLATFAELANGEINPALSVLSQLREDLSDGSFDSMNDENSLTNMVVDFGTTDLETRLNSLYATVISNYGDGTLDPQDLLELFEGFNLIGEWSLFMNFRFSFNGEVIESPPSEIGFGIPASLVPTTQEQAENSSLFDFAADTNLSSVTVDSIELTELTADMVEVEVDGTASQQGFTVPFVINYVFLKNE